MNWLGTFTQLAAILSAIMGATWFVIRQNSKIAAGVLAIKENDLRHLYEKLDALHTDTHAIAEKLDRHLEWHLSPTVARYPK